MQLGGGAQDPEGLAQRQALRVPEQVAALLALEHGEFDAGIERRGAAENGAHRPCVKKGPAWSENRRSG
jgi:hypothetical protein